jgi:hypothetical protein
MVTVYSLIVIAPAGGGLVPVGNRRGRITRPLRFRAKRKFLDTHIRHAATPGLSPPLPPSPDVVPVIQSSLLAALVARVGGATGARPSRVAATRAVELPAKISTANEERLSAKAATQLIQGLFVFHPPCGRKETGRSILVALSSCSSDFIR